MQTITTTSLMTFGLCGPTANAFPLSTATSATAMEPSALPAPDTMSTTNRLNVPAQVYLLQAESCSLCLHHNHHHRRSCSSRSSEREESLRLPVCCGGHALRVCRLASPRRRGRGTSSGTRKMAHSLRRMGDELYLRRMPLHSLVTLLLFQVLPGGWGKRALSRWLVTVPPGDEDAHKTGGDCGGWGIH